MDVTREELRWYALIGAALAISGILLLVKQLTGSDHRPASAVVAPVVHPRPVIQHARPHLPTGEWKATGVVVYVPPGVDSTQPEGAVLKRSWRFTEACRGKCQIVFTRSTLYGPSTTTLGRHGERFTAHFPPVDVPCYYHPSYSGPRHLEGESHDSYVLWWEGTQLKATEHRTETGCYPEADPPDVTRWNGVIAPSSSTL